MPRTIIYKALPIYQSDELHVSFKLFGLHKFILGLMGFLFISFEGMAAGLFIGSLLDLDIEEQHHPPNPADLGISFMMLAISVMKVNGHISTAERLYAHRYMRHYFGFNYAESRSNLFYDLEKQTIQIEAVCEQLNFHLDKTTKVHLVHFLFGTALASGSLSNEAHKLIRAIGELLGLSGREIGAISQMHAQKQEDIYALFDVDVDAPFEMVRKAYHKLAQKIHPDKAAHMGEAEMKMAKEKFQQLQAAYERIKLERGIA